MGKQVFTSLLKDLWGHSLEKVKGEVGAEEGAEKIMKSFDNPTSPIMRRQLRLREINKLVADPTPGGRSRRNEPTFDPEPELSQEWKLKDPKTLRKRALADWLLFLRNKALSGFPLTSSPELGLLENHHLLGPCCVPGTGQGFDVLDLI